MKNSFLNGFFYLAGLSLIIVSCTKLDEIALDGITPQADAGGASGQADLITLKKDIAFFYNEWARRLGITEMPADGLAGPTRGGDWDDNAALRQIHGHQWAPDHPWIRDSYNGFMTGIYNADLILNNSSQADIHPQAKFVKAFMYYHMIDNFGQVPYRESYDDMTLDAMVYTRSEAFDIALQLAQEAHDALPSKSVDASIISKDAAKMLLAKLYLNKAVFKSEPGSTDYQYDAADMTKVIELVSGIQSSLNSTDDLAYSYWQNFDEDNHVSDEIVFSLKKLVEGGTENVGDTQYYWRMGMHYNQTPGGWNGAVITAEYYSNYFNDEDPRKEYSNDKIIEALGNPVGIQKGQMYAPGGQEPLKDRKGNNLIYTPFTSDIGLVVLDPVAIESAGYRPMKYIPGEDQSNGGNDNIVFRYSDALLMAAEASLRGGSGGDAQEYMDMVRSRVGLESISATLENVYAERARELWLEGWRRNDMIRFGTFLEPKALKPTASDPKVLLFPFPADALLNPNITQNPGY
jgi:hypothetical protein